MGVWFLKKLQDPSKWGRGRKEGEVRKEVVREGDGRRVEGDE